MEHQNRTEDSSSDDSIRCKHSTYLIADLMDFVEREARRHRVFGADLEDLCNDALIELLIRASSVVDPFAYLGTIMRRLCSRLKLSRTASRASEIDFAGVAESVSASGACRATLLSQKKAVAALPPADRQIVLAWAFGFTDRELAGATGVAPGAIRVRVHRVRKQLLAFV